MGLASRRLHAAPRTRACRRLFVASRDLVKGFLHTLIRHLLKEWSHESQSLYRCVSSTEFSLTLPENADAWPRLSRRRNTGSYSGSVQVAAKTDGEAADLRKLNVDYDYDKAKAPEVAFADQIRVFVRVLDKKVLDVAEPLVAEVKLTDLTDTDTTYVKYCPVSLTSDADDEESQEQIGTFEVKNEQGESIVQPARVYRLFVNLHRQSEEYGEESVLGQVPTPYYVATSGKTILQQARQQISMRTFREFYYTERGWNRQAEYPMHCVEFYRWATGPCTVGADRGRTNLARLFRGRNSYRNGTAIRGLSAEEAVHGDYLATATHVFMLLAYDRDNGQAWTMEGNFNHTIEVCLRPVSSSWIYGHLAEEHIVAEAIRPNPTPGQDPPSVALSETAPDARAIP